MQSKKNVVIGIAGPAASGKSLLARSLVDQGLKERVVIIHADNYYKDQSKLSTEERSNVNYDHPKSIDNALLATHITDLVSGKSINMPEYDYLSNIRKNESVLIMPHQIIVLEGFLTLAIKELRQLMDIKIYVDTPLDICLMRRIRRDVLERGRNTNQVLYQYNKYVRPMFLKYIEPSKKYAHIIVPKGGKNKVALDMIKSRISEILKK